ncbi:MAG: ATP-binding protein [Anaerovoracaceae bacterium]
MENFMVNNPIKSIEKWITMGSLSCFLFFINTLHHMWLNPIAFCLTLLVMNFRLFSSSYSTKIALAIFFSAIPTAVEFFSAFVFSLIFQNTVSYVLSLPHNKIIATVIATFTLWVIVKAVKLSYPESKYNVPKLRTNGLLMLPISSIIILYSILYFERWVPPTTENAFLASSICVLLGLVNLVVFSVYDGQMKNVELKAQLVNAKLAQEKTEEYYHAQEQYLQDMHAQAHDFKNQLSVIRAMSSRDESLNNFLDQLSAKITNVAKGVVGYTTNKAINVIIFQKQQLCSEYSITMTIEITYPKLDFIQYSDACSIFGNALDNAITACMLQVESIREIGIHIFLHNNMLVIEFVNSKNPSIEIVVDKKAIIKTTKRQAHLHGYGLINITESVNAYYGRVFFNYTDDTFTVTIYIPINEE